MKFRLWREGGERAYGIGRFGINHKLLLLEILNTISRELMAAISDIDRTLNVSFILPHQEVNFLERLMSFK